MRIPGIVLLLVSLITAGPGCNDKDSVPSGVLSPENMQGVLWDMIQADQYSAFLAKDSAHINVKLENLRLYDQVFQLHHISREEFSKSYTYYMAHPDLTQALLDSISTMANRLRSERFNRPAVVTPSPAAAPPPSSSAAPVPRPSVASPAAPGQGRKADTAYKRPMGLPVTPKRPLMKRADSPAALKPL